MPAICFHGISIFSRVASETRLANSPTTCNCMMAALCVLLSARKSLYVISEMKSRIFANASSIKSSRIASSFIYHQQIFVYGIAHSWDNRSVRHNVNGTPEPLYELISKTLHIPQRESCVADCQEDIDVAIAARIAARV